MRSSQASSISDPLRKTVESIRAFVSCVQRQE